VQRPNLRNIVASFTDRACNRSVYCVFVSRIICVCFVCFCYEGPSNDSSDVLCRCDSAVPSASHGLMTVDINVLSNTATLLFKHPAHCSDSCLLRHRKS